MRHFDLPPNARRVAARQHGVISGGQLLESGLTRRQIRIRLEHGALVAVFGDTYRIGGASRTTEAALSSAVLSVPDGTVSHGAAGWVLDLPPRFVSRSPIVTVERERRHAIAGITIHRSRDLLDRHRTVVRGLPVTTMPRTVIDLAGQLTIAQLGDLVDELHAGRRLAITRLHDEHDRIARRGRSGTAALRTVLKKRLLGRIIEPSELERQGLEFLRRNGFPEPTLEFVPPWASAAVSRVDMAFPELRWIIELDGRRWHDRSAAFETDRVRDQLASANGWLVSRVTWRQLRDDEAATARRLASTMTHRMSQAS